MKCIHNVTEGALSTHRILDHFHMIATLHICVPNVKYYYVIITFLSRNYYLHINVPTLNLKFFFFRNAKPQNFTHSKYFAVAVVESIIRKQFISNSWSIYIGHFIFIDVIRLKYDLTFLFSLPMLHVARMKKHSRSMSGTIDQYRLLAITIDGNHDNASN